MAERPAGSQDQRNQAKGAHWPELRKFLLPGGEVFRTRILHLGNIYAVCIFCNDFLLLSPWFYVKFALKSNIEREFCKYILELYKGKNSYCSDVNAVLSLLREDPQGSKCDGRATGEALDSLPPEDPPFRFSTQRSFALCFSNLASSFTLISTYPCSPPGPVEMAVGPSSCWKV